MSGVIGELAAVEMPEPRFEVTKGGGAKLAFEILVLGMIGVSGDELGADASV